MQIRCATFLFVFLMLCHGVYSQTSSEISHRSIAGKYLSGDGLGSIHQLELYDNGRFYFGHSDSPSASGVFDFSDGILQLHNEVKSDFVDVKNRIERLNFIAWGGRRYFVKDEELLGFCNSVNLRFEPRTIEWGEFLLHLEDSTIETNSNAPALPTHYRKLLLDNPVHGKVTTIRRRKAFVDIGRIHGVFDGMVLSVIGTGAIPTIQVEVTKVFARSCVVRSRFSGDRCHVGQAVSSVFAGQDDSGLKPKAVHPKGIPHTVKNIVSESTPSELGK